MQRKYTRTTPQSPALTYEKLLARLLPDGECLVWPGSKSKWGYGRKSYLGKLWETHRLFWVLGKGPIPDNLQVLHTCDNPPCCKLEHLFLGTQLDNVRDMESKGRRRNAPIGKNGHTILTIDQVREIKTNGKGERGYLEIARKYGVSRGTIRYILVGETWKDV